MLVARFFPQVLMALTILTIPTWAPAQTTSDLLEKAVYAEETSGDLGEAIELYGQVIAKTKAATHIGAEAQYRLGLCLEKQGDKKKADEAFQAVVDNFPKETEFVSLAKKRLPGALTLLPVPWKDGQQLRMEMSLPTGMGIGVQLFQVNADEHDDQPVWRCSNRVLVTLNGANSFSEVFCDKQSFAPIESFWKHSMLGQAEASYSDGEATIDLVGREDALELDFTFPGYDNEQCAQVFRRLPLEVGFHTELPVIATLTGTVIPLGLDVAKKETITTALGEFDCFRMELSIGQTFWISDDENRYIVRFAAGGIIADLTRVEDQKKNESTKLVDEDFSIVLPAGWNTYEPDPEKEGRVIHLLDPQAIATSVQLTIAPKEGLAENQREKGFLGEDEPMTPQIWLDAALEKRAKRFKDYKVRDADADQLKLEEEAVASAIFDFTNKGESMTAYFVSLSGDRMAGFFKFVVPTEQFESQRSEYDQLVRSLRLK